MCGTETADNPQDLWQLACSNSISKEKSIMTTAQPVCRTLTEANQLASHQLWTQKKTVSAGNNLLGRFCHQHGECCNAEWRSSITRLRLCLQVHCVLSDLYDYKKACGESRRDARHARTAHAIPFITKPARLVVPSRKRTLWTAWCHGHAGHTHTHT